MLIDILNTISQYVCYLDYIKIKRINYWIFKNIKKIEFKQIFCNRMSDIIEDPEIFCKKMKECNIYIAGSSILDVLYGTNFSNDIDIYDGGSGSEKYLDVRYENDNSDTRFPFLKYIYTLNLKTDDTGCKASSSIYEGPIYMIRNYAVTHNKTLQHIIVRSKDVKKFIDNSFDLDICKTCFDGENLFVKNMDKLIHKHDEIKPFSVLMMYYVFSMDKHQHKLTEERMKKYISRGFNISKNKNYEQMYGDLINHISTFYRNNPENNHSNATCEKYALCGDKFHIIMDMINNNMTNLDVSE